MLYRVNFVSFVGTLQIVNVFHVRTNANDWIAGAFGGADPHPSDLATEVDTALTTLYRAILGTNATLDKISVTTVPDPGNPSQVPTGGEKSVNLAGTRVLADLDLPPALCGHITWRTDSSGKSFRGRTFLPPIEKTGAVGSDLIRTTDAYYTAAVAFGDKILNAHLASGSSWSSLWHDTWSGKFVVYSPTRHAAHTAPWTSQIKSYVMRREVGELRSRRK